MIAPVQRRLATILTADVAGYSRLMGRDEEGTLARLKAHRRELIDPSIQEHDGRIVKTMGDGLLAEFASPVEAVRCAVEIQLGMRDRSAGEPAEDRIEFRIGINLGDVIIEGDDIFGDGVNIAARLEGMAEPAGIYLSADVYRQVRGKLEVTFEDLGERAVKNIAEPLHVYRVRLGMPKPVAPETSARRTPAGKPSLAVLPLTNMSGDPEQEYFSDGITEDLITDLSKISGLFVIARNSTFRYKGQPVNVPQVGRELGVGYVLEGSVRRAANRVRITAQLIEAATGGHVWAERYDRELTDIFAVQDEVTREIVSALRLRLTGNEERRITARGTDNLAAYDLLLRGREIYDRSTPEANAEAAVLFREVIALDPNYAEAHARLGATFLRRWNQGWSQSPEDSLDPALECSLKALSLDNALPVAHGLLAHVLVWRREHERAVAEAERAVALDPNYADGYGFYAAALCWAGRSAEAIAAIERAMALNPFYPGWYLYFMGMAQFDLRDYFAAAATLKRAIARNPDFHPNHIYLAVTLAALGQEDEARREIGEVVRLNPKITLSYASNLLPYKEPALFEHFLDAARRAGFSD